jgi:D-cysteine desulfhydrase
MGMEHLFERYPKLSRVLPVAPLGRFPTPVERAAGLDAEARGAEMWVKRDDLSGAHYGGNKVRKLEVLLGRARADHLGRVVTAGAWGSHHALATTICGRLLGIRVAAVLYPQPPTEHVLDVFLRTYANGAEVRLVPSSGRAAVALALERLRSGTLVLPPGGSTPLGALGYVAAGLELAEQIRSGLCPSFARVYVPLGTGGTCAGLLVGLRLAGLDTLVRAVRVSQHLGQGASARAAVARLARQASALLCALAPAAPQFDIAPRDFDLLESHVGPGYGHSTAAAESAVEVARDKAGLALETTYTAKTLAAMLDDLALDPPHGPVAYWATASSVDLGPLPPPSARLPLPLRALYRNLRNKAPAGTPPR